LSHNEVLRDGKLVRDNVKLDDVMRPEHYKEMTDNQLYWTQRWADQMNYRYWKERSRAEATDKGVMARQLFYEATGAYKTGDFPKAADRFKEGLELWKSVMNEFPNYRDDELNKKDTGHIVKRYTFALKQLQMPIPDDMPFKDCLALVQNDTTLDPFDAREMIGVINDTSMPTPVPPAGAPASPGAGRPPAPVIPPK
jgi:hypothetical protein